MKVKFLQFPTDVQQVYDNTYGMQQALQNLAKGRPSTPRSWFYETKSPEWIFSQVISQLNSMKDLKELSEWDLDFKSKLGPQGEAAPLAQRINSFNEYFEHISIPEILKDPLFRVAQNKVIKILGFNQSGSPLTVGQVFDHGLSNDKYNTTSAYPLYQRKKSSAALQEASRDYSTCIEKRFPNTPGTRATPGKTGINARNIFMTAMSVVANGQRFQIPLQDYIRSKQIQFFTPWEGWDHVQAEVSKLQLRTFKLSADYDKMDQHFNIHHGMAVFYVVKHYFKKSYWDELEKIIGYVFNQPIVTNLGYINQWHALVSGSEWTNFLETVWNFIFWTYLSLKYHFKLGVILGVGDDQLIEFLGSENWSDQESMRVLDLIVNKEYVRAGTPGNITKNLFSREVIDFCQRRALANYNSPWTGKPWALVYRLLRCAEMNVWPETYHNEKMVNKDGKKVRIYNKYTFAQQVIMRTENLIEHPLFRWWIKFIYFSNPAIREFVALKDSEVREQELRSRKISNLYPTYNQEGADRPMVEFKTFRLLREVRAELQHR